MSEGHTAREWDHIKIIADMLIAPAHIDEDCFLAVTIGGKSRSFETMAELKAYLHGVQDERYKK